MECWRWRANCARGSNPHPAMFVTFFPAASEAKTNVLETCVSFDSLEVLDIGDMVMMIGADMDFLIGI